MSKIMQGKYIVFFVILFFVIAALCAWSYQQNSKQLNSGWYPSGTYTVGKDIPAGEYYAKSNDGIQGFYKINSVKSFQDCQIKCWDNFYNAVYFTVAEGDSLTINYAEFIKAADAPKIADLQSKYDENSYKVGKDLPAGEYELMPIEEGANYSLEKNSLHSSDSVIDTKEISKRVNIKLIDGQYLSFNNAVLIRE